MLVFGFVAVGIEVIREGRLGLGILFILAGIAFVFVGRIKL